ncbi:hypothetical protein PHLCEN_2v10754 [Hermanssonia centrifuga]|uniref:Riboflavin kinase n=1 Tax=Hermanssonia centrifuga TaxID=98765 RepID=A0A2R6NM61_9APHY|nr:hypothetical protein PHLCEN_2v10754 [Hermanssonia centrifuga]
MTIVDTIVETAAEAALHQHHSAPLSLGNIREGRPDIVGPDVPGQPFPIFLSGAVQRGFGRGGKDLGCPTANLPDESLPPMSSVTQTGVYYGYAQVSRGEGDETPLLEEDGKVHPMVMSLGWNPFYKNKQLTAEIHIMHDFSNDFYGHEMKAIVLGYIRPELDYVSRASDRAAAWDVAPPKHREPDAEILEHERKRKVEVKCLELQLELEDKGVEEDKIEEEVSALREKLLANMDAFPDARSLKPSDRHGIAAAKKEELSRMARALGTRADYTEGDAFDREKQEEIKARRMAEREEKDKQRDEERARMQAQKAKWEAERKERDRLRRREEDKRRRERDEEMTKRERMPPPPPPSGRDRDLDRGRDYRDRRSRSPVRRGPPASPRSSRRGPATSRSPSPPPVSRRRPASRSPSPPPRPRRRLDSHSPSPPPRYRRSGSVEPPSRRARGTSASPPPHPRRTSELDRVQDRPRSPPPHIRRDRRRSPSISPVNSPMREEDDKRDIRGGRKLTRSPSPPPRGQRAPRRGRSSSSDSSMSVSSGSSRSRSRSMN